MSLWLDEGFTVWYSRLPWVELFGLRGQYDVHPPLYYAAVKLAALFAPEASAGRLVSALAGAATVLVLYAIVARVAGRAIALAAAAILALSPLHVWYSQEARMYALAVLLVACSYLALIGFDEGGAFRWVVGYGVAVLLALYTDFSAAYALAPQPFLLLLLLRRCGRRALALWGVGAVSVILFLPWLYAATASVGSTANRQEWFLGVSLGKIASSLLAIGGFSAGSSDYWSPAQMPWSRWPALRGALLVLVVPTVGAGIVALVRQRSFAPIVATALLAGTIGTATIVSVSNPGYAERTVLYATLGWALLVGAAPFATTRPVPQLAGVVAVLALLLVSALATGTVARGAQKQNYRALANETARVAAATPPVLTDHPLTATFLSVYEPTLASMKELDLDDPRSVARVAPLDAFWFAYADYSLSEGESTRKQLAALGYERRTHTRFSKLYYQDTLFLDLFVRPGAATGVPSLSRRGWLGRINTGGATMPGAADLCQPSARLGAGGEKGDFRALPRGGDAPTCRASCATSRIWGIRITTAGIAAT